MRHHTVSSAAAACCVTAMWCIACCSGSLRDRAERLFSVRNLTPEQYPKKLLAAKTAAPAVAASGAGAGDAAAAAAAPPASVPSYVAGIPGVEGERSTRPIDELAAL
jgi:hypothetical protein